MVGGYASPTLATFVGVTLRVASWHEGRVGGDVPKKSRAANEAKGERGRGQGYGSEGGRRFTNSNRFIGG